ncbi:unnamed protein product [Meganyctiphanes norvegica]|uniref:RING-type domain-containing protein n=1 Tax=Meganyctiphanes norvegica TaxID=48144 RepID=A0AAV2PZE5_MEGNR
MDFFECKICHVPYDEDDHRPRNALCGHGLCTACIRALIKDSILECPTCRQKNKAETADDLQINFDLIDAMRAFKSKSIHLAKETESQVSGASNEELCNIHSKSLGHWCLKCLFFICDDCLEYHSSLTDCATIIATKAMKGIKEKPLKNIDMLLKAFEKETKYVSSKIKEKTEKRNELLEKADRQKKELIERADREKKKLLERAEKEEKELLEKAAGQKKELLERAEKEEKELLEKADSQNKKLMDIAEKHDEGVKMLSHFLEQGNIHKEKLIASKQHLTDSNSTNTVRDGIRMISQRKHILLNWVVKTLGKDTYLGLAVALNENKDVFSEMVIKDEERHAKLSQNEESIFIHSFQKQKVSEGHIFWPLDRLQKMIPPDASLVFVDLLMNDSVMGRVQLRLHKNLPNIREHLVHIFTGQQEGIMVGRQVNNHFVSELLGITNLPFSGMKVTRDSNEGSTAQHGDVFGYFGNGYLKHIYFYVAVPPKANDYGSNCCVFGRVEKGMDIVKACHDKSNSNVVISDCGLVLEQE